MLGLWLHGLRGRPLHFVVGSVVTRGAVWPLFSVSLFFGFCCSGGGCAGGRGGVRIDSDRGAEGRSKKQDQTQSSQRNMRKHIEGQGGAAPLSAIFMDVTGPASVGAHLLIGSLHRPLGQQFVTEPPN